VHLARSSGILLHPTSLTSGRLGEEANRFVDWLAEAGQSWWQVLPLGPPDGVGSPYKARSAFAGWTGMLAEPDAEVSAAETEAFVAAHRFWIGDWRAYAGADAVAGQVRFAREWGRLREHAASRGVQLFGDMPIYVADGSADHVAHDELFQHGAVAGVPPDYFSEDGQLWGNPLYDWSALRDAGFRWWVERFRRTFDLVDLCRVDHFRGFVAYWAVPEGAATAREGTWRRGPGRAPFDAARTALGDLQVVAEDLGVITPAVERLRDELGYPGMHVLQFGLIGDATNPHRLENHREWAVVYTGTHDNDTAVGFVRSANIDLGPEPHWRLIEMAMSSPARLAIVPMQDVLGLGSEARMNVPGTEAGNWSWRMSPDALTPELAARLRRVTERSGRAPG
jgi:4-alpha-glucanotransferase